MFLETNWYKYHMYMIGKYRAISGYVGVKQHCNQDCIVGASICFVPFISE